MQKAKVFWKKAEYKNVSCNIVTKYENNFLKDRTKLSRMIILGKHKITKI